MRKFITIGLAIITVIALPAALVFADESEPSGSREDTQFAYRETGILLAQIGSNLGGIGSPATQLPSNLDTSIGTIARACTGCIIGEHCFTEIPGDHTCCTAYRDRPYPRLAGLEVCLTNHPLVSEVEFMTWPEPTCGNRLIDDRRDTPAEDRESCEATPPGTQGSCNQGFLCNTCQCESPPLRGELLDPVSGRVSGIRCGDGVINGGEECEPGVPRGLSSGFECPSTDQVCSSDCHCVGPSADTCPSAFGGYPMGDVDSVCCSSGCKAWKTCRDRKCPVGEMPVAPFTDADCAEYNRAISDRAALGTDPECPAPPPAPVCVPNGTPEGTEQCDTFGLELHTAMDQLQARCPAPSAGQQISVCDMRDCSCAYIQTSCAGRTIDGTTVQCNGDTDCASDSVCDSNCQCHAIPPPPPLPPLPPVARQRDCSVEVMSFSSNSAKEKLDKLNKVEIAEITGRSDLDVYAEREQKVRVVCVTKALTAPRAQVVSEDIVMSSWDNIAGLGSMQLTQTGGSVFIDFKNTDQMKFKRVELVEAPVRILPMEGQTGISLSDSVPIGTLIPNITSSVSSSGDNATINNMIDYRGFNVGGGQTFSINASGSIDIQTSNAAAPDSDANRVDVFDFTIPTGCATWTGVEGFAGCKPYEDRAYDVTAVKNFISGQVAGGYANSGVVYDAPWENIDNFKFILTRPEGEHKFAMLAANPVLLGEGGGGCKGCYVNGTPAGAGEVLPALFAFIATLSGIVVRRIKRK